jgi:hypothetical protein
MLYLLGTTSLLTFSIAEMKIIKKQTLAEVLFHQNTSLLHIFKSVWLILLVSLFVAFGVSVVLLIQVLFLSSSMLIILALDVVLISFIYKEVHKRLSKTLKDGFLEVVARRWSVWINSAVLLVTFVIYQFFSTPQSEIIAIDCEIVNFLASLFHYKELLEWSVMSSSLSSVGVDKSFFSWLIYLFISQGVFVWAYSKLLLSVDVLKLFRDKESQERKNYFLFGFIGTIFLLLISTLVINHLYDKKIQEELSITYVQVQKSIGITLESGEEKMLEDIDVIIENEVNLAFSGVYDGVPDLSDYYYSLKGEYTRVALKGHDVYCGYKNGTLVPYYNQFLADGYKLKKCNEKMLDDEINSKIDKYLFSESNFDEYMKRISTSVNEKVNQNMQSIKAEISVNLDELDAVQTQNIENDFEKIFTASSRDMAKKGLSGTGAILLTSTISKSIISKMLLKLGAKGAGKAASFVAGSASGITICAPSGPWAFLCGVVTGTVAWVGVDAAMTEVDQAFNEDDFELNVRKMIDSEKETLKSLMKESYKRWIVEIFVKLNKNRAELHSPYEQIDFKK